MADHLQLNADERTVLGNGPTRRLRRGGLVPGVVYQRGQDSAHFSVPQRELRRLLSDGGRTSVIDLAVGGGGVRPVIFKDWQLHPVRGEIMHVDFQVVDLTVAIEVPVGIALVGTAAGVREGGILDQPLREVTVRALPDLLPEAVEHDVSELEIGDALTVGDLVAPEGVEITSDPEVVVASIVLPRAAVEEEVEAVEGEELEEGAEPAEGEEAGPSAEGGDEGGGSAEG